MDFGQETIPASLFPPFSVSQPILAYLLTCLLAFLLIWGCGYHFAGNRPLPGGLRTMSFGVFTSETLEVGIEKDLQWAMEREFRRQGGFQVTEAGEGVLDVTIRQFDIRPVAFSRRDQVFAYEVAVVLDLTLTDRATGEVLWQATGVRETEEYSATPQVVVTTSPDFQRRTLNPEDLSGLTQIQFSEAQEQIAVDRLFEVVAREVHLRLTEDF